MTSTATLVIILMLLADNKLLKKDNKGEIMKNFKKKFTVAAVLTAMVATVLSGCAKKFDATTYVKGTMDAYFKNEVTDQYAKMVDGGKEAIQKAHDEQIEILLDDMREAGCPDHLVEQYRDMYIDLFSKCKYTVSEATEDKSTKNFTVTVSVEPLNLDVEGVSEQGAAHIGEWAESQDATDPEALQAAAIEEMFNYMLTVFKEKLAAPEYLEAKTFEIHVNKGKNDIYEVPQNELEEVFSTATGF